MGRGEIGIGTVVKNGRKCQQFVKDDESEFSSKRYRVLTSHLLQFDHKLTQFSHFLFQHLIDEFKDIISQKFVSILYKPRRIALTTPELNKTTLFSYRYQNSRKRYIFVFNPPPPFFIKNLNYDAKNCCT